ncbi:MAG: M23 family metallopeptidase [Candidatus Thiodiazotropha taylori]|nr:M23 family metallopeptidase [Candidatus Thiodiazotropha taylori]
MLKRYSCRALAVLVSFGLIVVPMQSLGGFLDPITKPVEKAVKGGANAASGAAGAAVDVIKGDSPKGNLKKASKGAEEAAKGAVKATSGSIEVGKKAVKKSVDSQSTQSSRMPTDTGTGPTIPQNNIDGATAVAVGIVLFAIFYPDKFCEVFSLGADCNINASINVDDNGNVILPGGTARKPTEEELKQISDKNMLDWNKKIYLEDWEKELSEKFVAGWLVAPGQHGGITWFSEPLGNVTDSNELRADKGGHPMAGARRWTKTKGGGDIPRLHKGTDLATQPGDKIYASFSGKIVINEIKGSVFSSVTVVSASGHTQWVGYVVPNEDTEKGKLYGVRKGDVIALADNLHKKGSKYSKTVPNHVHVTYTSPEGIFIAPNNKFALTNDADWIAKHCKDHKCIAHNSELK